MSNRSRWAGLPTEAIHAFSRNLDRASESSILDAMADEDHRAVEAVRGEATRIRKGASKLASALSAGGRVFYVGAGTSGRLGVLEAAECPPTFGTSLREIDAVMAGGDEAVFHSKEGAEDEGREGRKALRARRLSKKDVVVGISASSVTPFVAGALLYARERGAATVLVTCGPRRRGVADVVVAPAVGPELLAGSTRMKVGTATKLVLNQMTLLAMIRLNKVYGPYMVDVKTTSAKLRDRALRMVVAIAGVDRERAEALLAEAGDHVKTAVVMGRLEVSRSEARRRLEEASFNLRRILK